MCNLYWLCSFITLLYQLLRLYGIARGVVGAQLLMVMMGMR